MNLKHSGRVSSLDALDMNMLRHKFRLYREITPVVLDDTNQCLMIPYKEDASAIKNFVLKQYANAGEQEQVVAFGHLAINGAIQRYQMDNRNQVFQKSYEDDSAEVAAAIERTGKNAVQKDKPKKEKGPPKYLSSFKRLFSGHFHHHHYVGSEKILYCGAPMQHHFGDSGDVQRGVTIYDSSQNTIEFVQNPNADRFRVMRIANENELNDLSQYRGKHVSVIYESLGMNHEKVQNMLLQAGAQTVRKHSISVRPVAMVNMNEKAQQYTTATKKQQASDDFTSASLDELVQPYVELYMQKIEEPELKHLKHELVQTGVTIIKNAQKELGATKQKTKFFDAKLKTISIQNFLSIQEEITIHVDKLVDGVWLIEGENGSGKSTILEAVSWCLFEKNLRSDMKGMLI